MPNKLDKYSWTPLPGISKRLSLIAFMLLAGYVWILPIAHTTTVREIFFFSLLFITLWAAWRKGLKLMMPLLAAWVIYGAVAGVSLFYALDPLYSLKEIKSEIGYGMLTMLIAASWVRNEKALEKVVWLLIAGNVFLVCIGIIQVIHLQLSFPEKIVTAPLDIGVGKFSTYIILVIPFIIAQAFLSFKRSFLASFLLFLLLCANLIALHFTVNRAAWPSLLIELILMASFLRYYRISPARQKIVIGAFLCLLIVASALNFTIFTQRSAYLFAEKTASTAGNSLIKKIELSNDPRLDLWRTAINNIKQRPFSGGGFGREAFKMLNPEYSKKHSQMWHAHNMFLNKGVQMGIPGIVAFCLLLGIALRKMWLIIRNSSTDSISVMYAIAGIAMVTGMIIKNLTDDFFVRDTGWLFWLVIAAIIGASRRDEQL